MSQKKAHLHIYSRSLFKVTGRRRMFEFHFKYHLRGSTCHSFVKHQYVQKVSKQINVFAVIIPYEPSTTTSDMTPYHILFSEVTDHTNQYTEHRDWMFYKIQQIPRRTAGTAKIPAGQQTTLCDIRINMVISTSKYMHNFSIRLRSLII